MKQSLIGVVALWQGRLNFRISDDQPDERGWISGTMLSENPSGIGESVRMSDLTNLRRSVVVNGFRRVVNVTY